MGFEDGYDDRERDVPVESMNFPNVRDRDARVRWSDLNKQAFALVEDAPTTQRLFLAEALLMSIHDEQNRDSDRFGVSAALVPASDAIKRVRLAIDEGRM